MYANCEEPQVESGEQARSPALRGHQTCREFLVLDCGLGRPPMGEEQTGPPAGIIVPPSSPQPTTRCLVSGGLVSWLVNPSISWHACVNSA